MEHSELDTWSEKLADHDEVCGGVDHLSRLAEPAPGLRGQTRVPRPPGPLPPELRPPAVSDHVECSPGDQAVLLESPDQPGPGLSRWPGRQCDCVSNFQKFWQGHPLPPEWQMTKFNLSIEVVIG